MKTINYKQIYLPNIKNYIDNIDNNNYIKQVQYHKLLLTQEGYIEIVGENYIKKHIILNDSFELHDYLVNHNIAYVNDITETSELINNIPFEHNYLVVEKHYYKLSHKSKIRLIIEKVGNKIKDIYFYIPYIEKKDLINSNIKEEIVSFLLNLK